MQVNEIRCDNCQKDITVIHSGYDEFRLKLSAERIRNTCSVRYGVITHQPIERDMDFCCVACLKEYFE